MSFMKECKDIASVPHYRYRKIDEIRETLGEKDFDEFMKVLQDKSISASIIARVLENRGVKISSSSIVGWRNRNGDQ
jgi:hypothetical protein